MIYLDNAATTLHKPPEVSTAVYEAINTCANAGRGGHSASMLASEVLFNCRQAAADMFGVTNPEQVVFALNTTHALNVAIKGIMKKNAHCVISGFEHNSVVRPLKEMEKNGVKYSVAHSWVFDPEYTIKAIKNAVKKDTTCIVCTHVSNAFGYVLPIEEIDAFCYSKGIPLIIDAAQSAGSIPLSIDKFKAVKSICMPGHKGLYGPQGTGILLLSEDTWLPSLMQGGTGSVSGEFKQPDFLPDMHESGTQNIHGIAGLLEGIKYVQKIGVEKINKYEKALINKATELLKGITGVKVFAKKNNVFQNNVLSFNIDGHSSEDVAFALNEKGIAVRGGLHCAPLAHKSAGTPYGTVRMSVSWFNDEEEIMNFARAVKEIAK